MAGFLLNGNKYPAPASGLKVLSSISVNGGRNAYDEFMGQVTGRRKYKLDALVWPLLDPDTWHKIQQEFNDFARTNTTFWSTYEGKLITVFMYPGDISEEPIYKNDDDLKPIYLKNCKVNIVDVGLIGDENANN